MSLVAVGVYGKDIALPPSVRDHPENVNPSRVGAVGAEIEPPVAKPEFETSEPPFSSKLTMLAFAFQIA